MNQGRTTKVIVEMTAPNITVSNGTTTSNLDLFLRCFAQQSCDSCLRSQYPCSWCETSQVCVSNTYFQDPFAILTPLKYDDVCPLAWREKWEMRAKPFSCRCSSMTFLSVVITVASTLAAIMFIQLIILLIRVCSKRLFRKRDLLTVSRRDPQQAADTHRSVIITIDQSDSERQPLLRFHTAS